MTQKDRFYLLYTFGGVTLVTSIIGLRIIFINKPLSFWAEIFATVYLRGALFFGFLALLAFIGIIHYAIRTLKESNNDY